jgi:predicted lactoylglutathione lyase
MSEPRAVSLITLGVRDLDASQRFYETLGFANTAASQKQVRFLRAANTVIGLYGRAALAEDAQVEDTPTGFSAVTLALNFAEERAVDAMYKRALAAGAAGLKQPQKVFWGGYSGYFADPDNHLWEVAHNPFFAMDASGRLDLTGGEER